MPLATKLSEVAGALFDKLDEASTKTALGIKATYYGDQDKIPTTPVVCVEPDEKRQEYKNAQRMTRLDFTVFILIYHSGVRSPQANRREADQLAEDIENLIHLDNTLGGLLIHSLCTNTASGYSFKEGSLMRSSRITFYGLSQALLPS